ncbi:hypothetical protein [Paenibacillus thalictri]|uniref:hypothetical protein n=1 Tax=Paenibacillus thalictri TaxID=2527873 RepID=UPI0013EF1D61|nr:hypothetical protein [Paenibacillus thalictri]
MSRVSFPAAQTSACLTKPEGCGKQTLVDEYVMITPRERAQRSRIKSCFPPIIASGH